MKNEARFMWLALATSGSTLVCCALPALLISLGAGAALASLLSAIPALVWVSRHHTLVFSASGVMLLFGAWLQLRPAACPADAKLAAACAKYKLLSKWLFIFSVAVYSTGLFFAYILPALKSI